MFAPKCNQDQMLTTISPTFSIDTYLYLCIHVHITFVDDYAVGKRSITNRSSQWTHPFSKSLCAFFYQKQLLKLNNLQRKTYQITCDPFLDQIIRITSRPSKLTHNFTNPYIFHWLISTYLIELNLLHMMLFWIKSSK
mgnify:CR=1 FL=1